MIAQKTISTVNEKLKNRLNFIQPVGKLLAISWMLSLFNRNLAAFDLDSLAAGQGFAITIGKSDEAAAVAEFDRFTGADLQFSLARALRHDDRLGVRVTILDAGSKGRSSRDRTQKNGNCKLVHILPGVSTAPVIKGPTCPFQEQLYRDQTERQLNTPLFFQHTKQSISIGYDLAFFVS
jgi:hypothetical protein